MKAKDYSGEESRGGEKNEMLNLDGAGRMACLEGLLFASLQRTKASRSPYKLDEDPKNE